jgi:dTDP-4-dehydrorhamnose reductase
LRIAITGASGLLGRALIASASPRHDIIAGIHSAELLDAGPIEQCPLDLTDAQSIRRFVDQSRPDYLIHSAAITDVDLCELEPRRAQSLNADATRLIVDAVRGSQTRVVYISTDYVFDGTAGPYAETDETNPINVYGKTKLEGELAVRSLEERGVIVRSASFLGIGSPERPTFAERMLETMRTNPPLKAAVDQISNVTPVVELAVGIMRLIESGGTGIWHIAHPRLISRYDLAVILAARARLDADRCVQRVAYETLGRAARRPLQGGLNCEKAIGGLGLTFSSLEDWIAVSAVDT